MNIEIYLGGQNFFVAGLLLSMDRVCTFSGSELVTRQM